MIAHTRWLVAVVMITALAIAPGANSAETPKVGDKVPLITGKDQDGKAFKLAEIVGKKIMLLYFYPKDDTPGCTKEACGLRDRMSDLKKDNVAVIGVSMDNEESHKKFIAKHDLNFPLLADTDGTITETFGAQMVNRKLSRRVSFLIGLDGRIAHVTDNPSADMHLSEMKDAIAKLAKK